MYPLLGRGECLPVHLELIVRSICISLLPFLETKPPGVDVVCQSSMSRTRVGLL